MFRPSETANELFRRIHKKSFEFRTKQESVVVLQFGEMMEVLCQHRDISEAVLGATIDFATQFENGVIIYLSTANNLYNSLLNSRINLKDTELFALNDSGRVKSIVVQNLSQLCAAIELVKVSLKEEKCLIILEGLSALFLAHKALTVHACNGSLLDTALKTLQALNRTHYVVTLVVNSVQPKLSGSLRDGSSSRDVVAAIWKQAVPKVVNY